MKKNNKVKLQKNEKSLYEVELGDFNSLDDPSSIHNYGEFVSSYFAWLSLDGQKNRANELSNMTKKDK